jgi:peptidoglycan/xylan/chitin deacetylase (PgdA/CDA1 family)
LLLKSDASFWTRLNGFYQRKSSSLLFRRVVKVNPERPLISFTFDDFPRSALLEGGKILNSFGLAGTYYASFGLMGQVAPTGEIFVEDDLKLLTEQGHELGCHTFSHSHSWDTGTAAFERSVEENRLALKRAMPGLKFKTFSYPISPPRPRTKIRIGRRFLACRGGGQVSNIAAADLNHLRAFFLEKSRDNMQAIQDVIDDNRRRRGWLIFAAHDISETPTRFGCTPRQFEAVVRYAVASGALIAPVDKALTMLGHRPEGGEVN